MATRADDRPAIEAQENFIRKVNPRFICYDLPQWTVGRRGAIRAYIFNCLLWRLTAYRSFLSLDQTQREERMQAR